MGFAKRGKVFLEQGSEHAGIHFQLGSFIVKFMHCSQRQMQKGEVYVGAVGGCALVSALDLYLAKDDNIIAAL